jgi:putative GTP pyrophosphokinase
MEQKEFLEKYLIDVDEFKQTNLIWENLQKIKTDYESFKIELEEPVKYILEAIHKFNKVHSIRYRIKDSEHLIEKIIRKKIEGDKTEINIDNYKTLITDLIGFRILHLFKEDWLILNDAILKKWDINEEPIAYIREGDDIKRFENNCKTKIHKYNYRSVHYNIKTNPCKQTYYAEIQVRTIYEEAWSEIDHKIRYPYDRNNPILLQYLNILNGLSGSADEMGSFIVYLKKEIQKLKEEHEKTIAFNQKIINELKAKIKTYEFKEATKVSLIESDIDKFLSQIKINPISENNLVIDFPKGEDYEIALNKSFKLNLPDNTYLDLSFNNNQGIIKINENDLNKKEEVKKKKK